MNDMYVAVSHSITHLIMSQGFKPRTCHYVRAYETPEAAAAEKMRKGTDFRVFKIIKVPHCQIRTLKHGHFHIMTDFLPSDCLEICQSIEGSANTSHTAAGTRTVSEPEPHRKIGPDPHIHEQMTL